MTATITLMNNHQIEAILSDAIVATKIGMIVNENNFVEAIIIEKVEEGKKVVYRIESNPDFKRL